MNLLRLENHLWVFFCFIRGLVSRFRQRGLTIYVLFRFFDLFIVGLHLLDFVRLAFGSCYPSMYLLANVVSNFFLFTLNYCIHGAFLVTPPLLIYRSWGFLCPVHTPDGEPCGLLNHMTCTCSKFNLLFAFILPQKSLNLWIVFATNV